MKTPLLFASLAVATMASAADLKDLTAVVHEWNQSVGQVSAPLIGDLGLRAQATVKPTAPGPDLPIDLPPQARSPKALPRAPLPLYDAPGRGYRPAPKTLPNDLPPGSLPFEFNGGTYWVVPLGPGRDK